MKKLSLDNVQSIFNILSQVLLNGVNFALIITFTHYLSTEDYGVVSLYIAYSLFAAIILGLTVHGSIGTALIHLEESKRKNYIASIMLLSCISFFTFCFIAFIFRKTIVSFTGLDFTLVCILFFHGFGISIYNFITIYNIFRKRAENNLYIVIGLALGMLLLSWIGIFYGEYFTSAYLVRILSLALPYIICGIGIIVYILRSGNPFIDFKSSTIFCLPICIPLIFHGLSHIVLSQTDKIMLQKLIHDNAAVGIYSFVVTFTHVLNTISIALNNTWVPRFYDYLKLKQYDNVYVRTKEYSNLFTLLTCGFLMVVPEFVYILADKAYWSGLSVLPVLTIAIYMTFLYLFPVNFELYHKESRVVACGTMGAALCNIIFNYFLIPYYGMLGAAVATLLSYILLVFFHMYFSNKIGKGSYPYNILFFAKYILGVLVACVVYYICFDYVIIRWGMALMITWLLVKQVFKNKRLF